MKRLGISIRFIVSGSNNFDILKPPFLAKFFYCCIIFLTVVTNKLSLND